MGKGFTRGNRSIAHIKKAISFLLVWAFLCNTILPFDLVRELWAMDNPSANSRTTLAPWTAIDQADLQEKFIAQQVLLSHEGINNYIKEETEKILGVGGEGRLHTETISRNGIDIKVIAIPNLLRRTGQPAHVGLGRQYGMPVIYIDSDLFDDAEGVLTHEIDEVSQWEDLRLNYLKNDDGTEKRRDQMREWIRDHIRDDSPDPQLDGTIYEGLSSRRIARLFHDESYPLDDFYASHGNAASIDFDYIALLLTLYGYDETSDDVNIAASRKKKGKEAKKEAAALPAPESAGNSTGSRTMGLEKGRAYWSRWVAGSHTDDVHLREILVSNPMRYGAFLSHLSVGDLADEPEFSQLLDYSLLANNESRSQWLASQSMNSSILSVGTRRAASGIAVCAELKGLKADGQEYLETWKKSVLGYVAALGNKGVTEAVRSFLNNKAWMNGLTPPQAEALVNLIASPILYKITAAEEVKRGHDKAAKVRADYSLLTGRVQSLPFEHKKAVLYMLSSYDNLGQDLAAIESLLKNGNAVTILVKSNPTFDQNTVTFNSLTTIISDLGLDATIPVASVVSRYETNARFWDPVNTHYPRGPPDFERYNVITSIPPRYLASFVFPTEIIYAGKAEDVLDVGAFRCMGVQNPHIGESYIAKRTTQNPGLDWWDVGRALGCDNIGFAGMGDVLADLIFENIRPRRKEDAEIIERLFGVHAGKRLNIELDRSVLDSIPGRLVEAGIITPDEIPVDFAAGGQMAAVARILTNVGMVGYPIVALGTDTVSIEYILLPFAREGVPIQKMIVAEGQIGQTTGFTVAKSAVSVGGYTKGYNQNPGVGGMVNFLDYLEPQLDRLPGKVFTAQGLDLVTGTFNDENARRLIVFFRSLKERGVITTVWGTQPDAATLIGQQGWKLLVRLGMLHHIDMFCTNVDEARNILGLPNADEVELVEAFLRQGVGAALVSRGSRGCVARAQAGSVFGETSLLEVPIQSGVHVAHPVGVGDAFVAGAIVGMVEDGSLLGAAMKANAVAGLKGENPGATNVGENPRERLAELMHLARQNYEQQSSSLDAMALRLLEQAWTIIEELLGTSGFNSDILAKVINRHKHRNVITADSIKDGRLGFLFSEKVTFGDEADGEERQGFGAALPKFANAGIKVAVLLSSDSERRARQESLIEELNKKIGIDKKEKWIRCGTTVGEISNKFADLKDSRPVRFYCLKTKAELKTEGVINSINIVDREVLKILGTIRGVVQEGQEPDRLYEAAKKFALASLFHQAGEVMPISEDVGEPPEAKETVRKTGNRGPDMQSGLNLPTITEPQDFVNKLRETWQNTISLCRFDDTGEAISGPFKFDPNHLKSKSVGRFQAFFNPWKTMGGLKPVKPEPVHNFRSMPQTAKLFVLKLATFFSLVVINQSFAIPNNFLLIPDVHANLDQRLTDKTLTEPILLARAREASDLKFAFNSKGGWASVGQLHFHGFFNQSEPWPIETAPKISVANAHGVNIERITGYPAGAAVFSGDDVEVLAKETVKFVNYLEDKGITYHCLITKESIYVLPRPERSLQPSQVFKRRLSIYDLCGIIIANDEQTYNTIASGQIESEIRQASYGESELNDLVNDYVFHPPASTVVEVDRKDPIPQEGVVMVARDEQARLRILVDTAHSAKVNVRAVPDLEEFLPVFSIATENVPLYGYHSPDHFTCKLYSGWNYLPQGIRDTLSALFERKIVPLTYKKGEPLPGLSVLMDTNRSHNVAPGRGGLLLADGRASIFANDRGEEFDLNLKGCGPYDGTFEINARKSMDGAVGGKTLWMYSETPRGYVWEPSGFFENDLWEDTRSEPDSDEFSYPLPAFVVSFEIDGRRFALVGRADPGSRRASHFWQGTTVSKKQRLEMSKLLGRTMATMLLKRRPAIHTALNLENIVYDGRAIPSYTDGSSLKFLDTMRRARSIFHIYFEVAFSRAIIKFKDLHSAEGPRPYEEYRDPFWEGFAEVMASSQKVPEAAKGSLSSIMSRGTSTNTLAEVEDVLWKHFLPLEIVKARFKTNVHPLRNFQEPDKLEKACLPSLVHPLDWIPGEIAIYEAAGRIMDQDVETQAQRDLRNYIIETLTELRGALRSAGNDTKRDSSLIGKLLDKTGSVVTSFTVMRNENKTAILIQREGEVLAKVPLATGAVIDRSDLVNKLTGLIGSEKETLPDHIKSVVRHLAERVDTIDSVFALGHHKDVQGAFYEDDGKTTLYLNKELVDNPLGLIHELGESNAELPDNYQHLTRHTVMRGVGKDVRNAFDALNAEKTSAVHGADVFIDMLEAVMCNKNFVMSENRPRDSPITESEKELIRWNFENNRSGKEALFGVQDFLSPEGNARFTQEIRNITADTRQGVMNIFLMRSKLETTARQAATGREAGRKFEKKFGIYTWVLHFEDNDSLIEQLSKAVAVLNKNKEKLPKIFVDCITKEDHATVKEFIRAQKESGNEGIDKIIAIGKDFDEKEGAKELPDEVKVILVGSAIMNDRRLKDDFNMPSQDLLESRKRMIDFLKNNGIIDEIALADDQIDAFLDEIWRGVKRLMITRISWKEFQDWKNTQDEVLRSL